MYRTPLWRICVRVVLLVLGINLIADVTGISVAHCVGAGMLGLYVALGRL